MNLFLSESRYLRYASFTILYVAQGLPFGLVTVALPAFLIERGASPAAVGGFVGLAMLPWSLKLLAGPMMDRFTYLAMGRRRPWVLVAQLGLALTGLAFAFFPSGLDNLVTLTALCFVLNSFGAAQDVGDLTRSTTTIDRLGVRRFYLFALLAYGLLATAVGLSAFAWDSALYLKIVSSIQAFVYQGVFVSFIAIHMKLCGTRVAATQFAIYMAVVNFARSLGAVAIGALQPYLEYSQMFFVVAAGFFLAVVLLWNADLQAHQRRVGGLE